MNDYQDAVDGVAETAIDYVELPIPDVGNEITWDWLAGHLTPTSIAQYKRFWALYADFAGTEQGGILDDQTLRRWRDHMVLDTTLGVRTINTRLAGVARVIREAARRGHIDQGRASRCLEVERVSARALRDRQGMHGRVRLSTENVRLICEHPDPATMTGLRDRALLFFLASSACRVGEAVTLMTETIQPLGHGWAATVLGKTDIEPRQIVFSPEAKGWIDRWLQARPVASPYVFTGFAGRGSRPRTEPLSTQAAEDIVRSHTQSVGLQGITPHTFRAFVATELVRRDIGIAMHVLGHKNERTTLAYVRRDLEGGETNLLF